MWTSKRSKGRREAPPALGMCRHRFVAFVALLAAAIAALVPMRGFGADDGAVSRVFVKVTRSHLRAGPGINYKTVTIVSSGQELSVVARRGDWYKVSTLTGTTGWIIRRAVTSSAPAPVVIRELERTVKEMEAENQRLTAEIRRLSDARQDLELKASKLNAEVLALQTRNDDLQSWRTIIWGVIGLVVLLVGWALGFIAGNFRRQAEDTRYNAMMRDAAAKKM